MKPLTNNTLFLGKVVYPLDRVSSTNEYLKKIVSKNKPIEGTVIYTEEQYAGRGQIGSKWETERGKNIIMSLFLQPKSISVRRQFALSQAVALGVYEAFKPYVKEGRLKLKWPNDIYIDDQKMGGVLIENSLKGGNIDQSIVGIGLNINQTEFPIDLSNATSLSLKTKGKQWDKEFLMGLVCERIERFYLQLRAGKYALLEEQYLKCLYGIGEERSFYLTKEDKTINAQIKGVSRSGALLLGHGDNVLSFNLKEVRFLF